MRASVATEKFMEYQKLNSGKNTVKNCGRFLDKFDDHRVGWAELVKPNILSVPAEFARIDLETGSPIFPGKSNSLSKSDGV